MSDSYFRGHLQFVGELPVYGTLLGPNAFGEILVTRDCFHSHKKGLVELWTITRDDWDLALQGTPRSIFEFKLMPRKDRAEDFLRRLGAK